MALRIATIAHAKILAEAERAYPQEACGLLLGIQDLIESVVIATNIADDPKRCFVIDPAVQFAAHRAARTGGPQIVGCFHSHPDGADTPSAADAAGALVHGWWWLIAGHARLSAYRVQDGGPLHGRFEPVMLDLVL
jgi:proteasome lid subunit RPN8/RPN11